MIRKNSKGQFFQSGSGGNYPVNDGNPENDVEDFDPEIFQDEIEEDE